MPFRCLNKGFKPEVFYHLSDKLPLFSKTTLLQRKPFVKKCYTINSSPLLVPSHF